MSIFTLARLELGKPRRYLAIRKFKPGDEAIMNKFSFFITYWLTNFFFGIGKDDDGIE